MRYTNIEIDTIDRDYIYYAPKEFEGCVVVSGNDELIDIVNQIRKERGYTDLVTDDEDNDIYYDFYLVFNTLTKEIKIEAVANYTEKDDETTYVLPMTAEEERHVMFVLLEELAKYIYNYD